MARLVTELRAAGERGSLDRTLAGMVQESTDTELRAWLTSAPPAERPSTVLARHREEVLLIAERHGATTVRVIGSVARGNDVPGSDVDLLVGTQPGFSLLDLVGLADDLEELLGVPVDVLTEGGLRDGRDDGIRDEALEMQGASCGRRQRPGNAIL